MMRPVDPRYERLLDLMCDAELVGLTGAEQAEFATLEAGFMAHAATERRLIARAATGLAIAGAATRASEPISPALFARLEQSAAGVRRFSGSTPRRSRLGAVAPWLVAAACLVLAVGALVRRPKEVVVEHVVLVPAPPSAPPAVSAPPSPLEARAALVSAPGTSVLPWSRTKDPASKDASGDVVWNEERQQGFMRFAGLALNDPKSWQYQLWIFDGTGDARYPVDGGVFDIDAATGDIIVPIHANIAVGKATLFAVTVEKPGGVVVSKRQRIVVTAKVG